MWYNRVLIRKLSYSDDFHGKTRDHEVSWVLRTDLECLIKHNILYYALEATMFDDFLQIEL